MFRAIRPWDNASLTPVLPLTLIGSNRVATSGLVDSGATVNVLPYALGAQLDSAILSAR